MILTVISSNFWFLSYVWNLETSNNHKQIRFEKFRRKDTNNNSNINDINQVDYVVIPTVSFATGHKKFECSLWINSKKKIQLSLLIIEFMKIKVNVQVSEHVAVAHSFIRLNKRQYHVYLLWRSYWYYEIGHQYVYYNSFFFYQKKVLNLRTFLKNILQCSIYLNFTHTSQFKEHFWCDWTLMSSAKRFKTFFQKYLFKMYCI